MKTRVIVPLFVSAVMLATSAMAAGAKHDSYRNTDMKRTQMSTMTPQKQCTSLQSKFDVAIKKHEKAAKAEQAKAMRTEGGNLCAQGQHAEGVAKLQQALRDIGVKVKS